MEKSILLSLEFFVWLVGLFFREEMSLYEENVSFWAFLCLFMRGTAFIRCPGCPTVSLKLVRCKLI